MISTFLLTLTFFSCYILEYTFYSFGSSEVISFQTKFLVLFPALVIFFELLLFLALFSPVKDSFIYVSYLLIIIIF